MHTGSHIFQICDSSGAITGSSSCSFYLKSLVLYNGGTAAALVSSVGSGTDTPTTEESVLLGNLTLPLWSFGIQRSVHHSGAAVDVEHAIGFGV